MTQAFGSDWPVVSADAITAMHTAAQMPGIDRSAEPGLQHSVAAEDAMQAHTSTAAFSLGMEKHIGKLRQVLLSDGNSNYIVDMLSLLLCRRGMQADFVQTTSSLPKALRHPGSRLPAVQRTFVDGMCVHGCEQSDH